MKEVLELLEKVLSELASIQSKLAEIEKKVEPKLIQIICRTCLGKGKKIFPEHEETCADCLGTGYIAWGREQ